MDARDRSERRWLLGLVGFALAFWLLDLGVLRNTAPDPLDDTWEYGVAARHLLAGDGFRTDVIHPPLWSLRDERSTVPVLVHGPLMPVLIAPAVISQDVRAIDSVAWFAAAAALIAAWLTARIGARLGGVAAGVAGGALFTVSPLTVRAVHHDPSLVLGAAFLMLAIDFLVRERPVPLGAGLAIGLAALTRAEMSIAALLIAPLAGRRGAPVMLGAAIACLLPWWIHNALATGQPFFNLSSYLLIGYSPSHPGLSVLRDFTLAPADFPRALRDALPALPAKWADAFPHALKRALMVPTGGTGWLALIGAALGLASTAGAARGRALAIAFAGLALIPIAIMVLTLYDSRYLVPFLPLWTLAAARGAEWLARALPSWGRRPRTWIGALALMVLPSVAPALKEANREARALERRVAAERIALRPWSNDSRRLIYSDTPDFVAYCTRRPVVWMLEREYRAMREAEPSDSAALAPPRTRNAPPRHPEGDEWFHRGGRE